MKGDLGRLGFQRINAGQFSEMACYTFEVFFNANGSKGSTGSDLGIFLKPKFGSVNIKWIQTRPGFDGSKVLGHRSVKTDPNRVQDPLPSLIS